MIEYFTILHTLELNIDSIISIMSIYADTIYKRTTTSITTWLSWLIPGSLGPILVF